ncbi:MAG: hypothetical protein M0Z66_16525 [Thermaerobacter sp.]|nr:hypothetical protein [Thermaerobacter sp.]
MDQELKAYLDAMRQDLTGQITESRQHAERLNTETRRALTDRMLAMSTETREHAEHLHTEARVLIEDVGTKVGLVWEGVQAIKETLDSKLDDHEHRIQSLERKAL